MPGELLDLPTILDELVEAIAEIEDFAAVEGSVAPGWYESPPGNVPFACVSLPSVSNEGGRARADLWERVATFGVRAWRAYETDTQAHRTRAALELADELIAAFEDRYADSEELCEADDLVVRTALPGQVAAEVAPDFVHVELTVEVRYRRHTGRGV